MMKDIINVRMMIIDVLWQVAGHVVLYMRLLAEHRTYPCGAFM